MRSRAKQGQSGIRYRVDADGFPVHEESKRGRRKRLLRAATAERIRLEQDIMRAPPWNGCRMERSEARLAFFSLPTVERIAARMRDHA